MNQAIADLKSGFVGAGGVEKIAIARRVIEQRKTQDTAIIESNPLATADEYHYKEAQDAYQHSNRSAALAGREHFVKFINENYKKLNNNLNPEQKQKLDSEFVNLKKEYLEQEKKVLSVHSNVVSAHIAGNSKFKQRTSERTENKLISTNNNFAEIMDLSVKSIAGKLSRLRNDEQLSNDNNAAKTDAIKKAKKTLLNDIAALNSGNYDKSAIRGSVKKSLDALKAIDADEAKKYLSEIDGVLVGQGKSLASVIGAKSEIWKELAAFLGLNAKDAKNKTVSNSPKNRLPPKDSNPDDWVIMTSEQWSKTSKDYKRVYGDIRHIMRAGGMKPVFLSDKKPYLEDITYDDLLEMAKKALSPELLAVSKLDYDALKFKIEMIEDGSVYTNKYTKNDKVKDFYEQIINAEKRAKKSIFDSVDGYHYYLDDTTTMQTSIQDLKSQFPANNGMGKIALARHILQARYSVNRAANISGYYFKTSKGIQGFQSQKAYGIINPNGQALSKDGESPMTAPSMASAKEQAKYANGFKGYGWINIYNSIEEAKQGKNNAPSTNEILERNSQTSRNANSGNEKPVFNDGKSNGTNTGIPSATANQTGNQQQGDNRVPTDSPVIAGTQSNSSMVKGDGNYSPARTADDTGSGDVSRSGISDDRQRNETVAGIAQGTKKLDRAVKLALQAQAEGIDYEPTEENIRATLPFLLPEQQDDIVKIEARFKDNHGMLITNGTGTGKTFTALGAVKRFQKQGKDSILIVVPNDKIGQDFIDSAVNIKLTIKLLDGIKDNGGNGISITTYANFYQNESLLEREFDLVVFDESHKINSNAAGDDTRVQDMMRSVTNNPKGLSAKASALASKELGFSAKSLMDEQKLLSDDESGRYEEIDDNLTKWYTKRYEIFNKLSGKAAALSDDELDKQIAENDKNKAALKRLDSDIWSMELRLPDYEKALDKVNERWGSLVKKGFPDDEIYNNKAKYEQQLNDAHTKIKDGLARLRELKAEKEALDNYIAQSKADRDKEKEAANLEASKTAAPRTKVLFLSATPFAYEKSIDYAEGYLFDYKEKDGSGYNSGGGYEDFMMNNFGYSMRYNKLTQPDSGVNRGAMQRQFNEMLKKSGALSGRALKVEADYSREFIILKDRIGEDIDAALEVLSQEKYRAFGSYIRSSSFDYLNQLLLLEAIKAKSVVKRIKKHIALGRKVVVFHSYKVSITANPFELNTTHKKWKEIIDDSQREKIKSQSMMFKTDYPQFANIKLDNLDSPIETFKKAFGSDVMFYNGKVSKKQRQGHANDFNDDSQVKDVILMQTDAGKEGVSLHDTTGNKQRVLINLGLPTKPTDTIQIEGRIYRTGQITNAVFEYISTGTQYEKRVFADVIATRSSTAENLAMGNDARNLLDDFKNGYINATNDEPSLEQGTGVKSSTAAAELSPFEKAKSDYFATQKANKNTKAKGVDYFPTPEPIGLKMVELAGLKRGESALEPSAGHGAIARYFPDFTDNTFVEPSGELQGDLALRCAGGNNTIKGGDFESLHAVNKFDGIVMNPPFGKGGKMAIEHLEKACNHLRDGGRVVALIPHGGMADKRLNDFYGRMEEKNIHLIKTIYLPSVAFERAGTSVNTKIVILDRIDDEQEAESVYPSELHLQSETNINELFDRLEMSLGVPDRKVKKEKNSE